MKSEAVVLSLVFIFICFLAFLLVGSTMNKEKTYLKEKSGIYLSVVAICAAIYGLFLAIYIGENESVYIAFSSSLATLSGFYLVYQTFVSQRKEYEHNRIESRFFELLKIHQSNVQEMRHAPPNKYIKEYETGRRVFITIYKQLKKAEQELRGLSIVSSKFTNQEIKEIAYLIVFFGISKNMKEGALRTCLLRNENYKPLVPELIAHFENIVAKYEPKGKSISETIKYFGGHQSRLGHYNRHLYQAVTYVDSQKALSYNEKYHYMKILRAQMSTHEQVVFLYNSLSLLGFDWELKYRKVADNKCLVTKYDLIKNIPLDYLQFDNPIDFYPDVNYEGDDKTKRKQILEDTLYT